MEEPTEKKRIGVYICHCGGNISDYVDVGQLREMMESEENVVISKDVMFACADSNQKQMVKDIQEMKLDGIVVASCSPKLHLHTFRNVASRAGLNPYNYVQVNVREQCSWAHSDQPEQASYKAAGLIRAGIHRVVYSEALENIRISTQKSVLIIGAGVAGMKSALDLAHMGDEVYLIEKEPQPGGLVAGKGKVFPTGEKGSELVERLLAEIKKSGKIKLFTSASIEKISGSIGNFRSTIKTGDENPETLTLTTGAIMVATGAEPYTPAENEYGYHTVPGVITLTEFDELLKSCSAELKYAGKPVKSVSFIYCTGMRQSQGEHKYCSRICCTAAIHSSLVMHEKFGDVRAFHFYRDIRTYGKQEILFEKSSKSGDIYFMFQEKDPPVIEQGKNNIRIRVKDLLTRKTDLEIESDLVVLVTGMVPRRDSETVAQKLKIPVGNDRFFNEIHPKLRPVETVIDGVFLGGSCQGPRNISESVQSSSSAAAKIHAIIRKDTLELEPIVARINEEECTWCEKCAKVCEYDAIFQIETNGKIVASVNEAVCKGCGACTPVCPTNAINIALYTDEGIEGMIDGFIQQVQLKAAAKGEKAEEETAPSVEMKDFPQIWKSIMEEVREKPQTIPAIAAALSQPMELVTYHVMTMNRYFILEPAGIDDNDEYYLYKLKNKA
ncbi:MAG: CoB--CoM heterodisulfide reductase iron-sulfur subunit A family protein [Bacteroidota bacterium]|nr:CoB--CoM heterodisulfide reductase iron-sulfur subunit A family protein [Bacteroidota bacterium]